LKKIHAYVMTTVLQSIFVILSILLVLQFFILFMNQMGDLGKGSYHLKEAMLFVLLRLPYELSICFPIICLLGCLVGLSILANHSELVVMRASGLSIGDIIKIVAVAGIGLIILVMTLSESFVPKMIFKANNLKLEALNNGQLFRQAQSLWFRHHENFWYVSEVVNPYELKDVTMFSKDKQNHVNSIENFQKLVWKDGVWVAISAEMTYFSKDHKMSRYQADMLDKIHLPLGPQFFKHIERSADEMTIKNLYHRIEHLQAHQDMGKEKLIFWQRLMQPLNTLLMMVLAIPFIFGPLRSSTMGAKLIVGIAMGFGFYIMNQMFGFISQVYQIQPVIGATLPMFIFGIFGIYLLKQSR
jgi:lipopolysaccharide export system permease protein